MRTLPDHLRDGTRLIIVGLNPRDRAVRVGHYYSGRDNEFWPLLFESGLIPEPLEYREDKRIMEFGIGLTDLVKRPTRSPDELKREDFAEGRVILSQKFEQLAPQLVAFNGPGVYENFAQRAGKLGLHKQRIYGAQIFVLPAIGGADVSGRATKLRYLRSLAKLFAESRKTNP